MGAFHWAMTWVIPAAILIAITAGDTRMATATIANRQAPFDFEKAAARIDAIDAAFYPNYENGLSPFYGRVWRDAYAKKTMYEDSGETVWKRYKAALAANGLEPRQLDCTRYAKEILKAGLSAGAYRRLWHEHAKIWGADGFSGWSVGHLLTEKFGWRAYAVINERAPDYDYYMSFFQELREYPVWRQPNIRIDGYFISGKDDAKIEALLEQHPFGWGFSEGGIHTWITRGANLLESHFDSGPTKQYDDPRKSYRLLETTRFTEFDDYNVHLVVFPPDVPRPVSRASNERAVEGIRIQVAPTEPREKSTSHLSLARVRISGRLFKMVVPEEAALTAKPNKTTVTYRVAVEKGLEKEAAVFTETVDAVLNDPNGWASAGMRFVQTGSDSALITVLLVKPTSIDVLCDPLPTGGRLSCAIYRRANLNYRRWTEGASTFGDELSTYRSYLINHEVGHLIGMRHENCAKRGETAPVMLQQTKFLKGCSANGLPTPTESAKLRSTLRRRTTAGV